MWFLIGLAAITGIGLGMFLSRSPSPNDSEPLSWTTKGYDPDKGPYH